MIELSLEHKGQGTNVGGRAIGSEWPVRGKAGVVLNFKPLI